MQLATTLQRGWQNRSNNSVVSTINRTAGAALSRLGFTSFKDPVCGYEGPFLPFKGRQYAKCICGSLERHRLQMLVMQTLRESMDFSKLSLLHFAPEPELARHFKHWFGSYKSADLEDPKVDRPGTDISKLPFPDETFDCIFASDVLEHVQYDRDALLEIRRVLTPGGVAVLHVPIFAGVRTVEYKRANPKETNHWRFPGSLDYFNKHKAIFGAMRLYGSREFSAFHQLYIHEDRSHWPTPDMPDRLPIPGLKHEDFVPVCYKSSPKREPLGWAEVKEPEAVGA